MICSYCGTDLPLGAMFCGECGRPVAARAASRTRSRSSANSVATTTRWPVSVAEHNPDDLASTPPRPERRPADVDAAAHALVEPPRASDAVFAEPPPSAAKAAAAARAEAKARAADQAAADALELAAAQAQADADARAAAEVARADAQAERSEAERSEAERADAERAEAERIEAERAEPEPETLATTEVAAEDEASLADTAAAEAEAAQAVADKAAEQLAAQRAAAERAALVHAERERAEAERAELERVAAERAELERVAAERAAIARAAVDRAEHERAVAERATRDLAEAVARVSAVVPQPVVSAPQVVRDLVDANDPVETCAQCGAELAASDIFCGVCGFVRKPVAAAPTRPNDTVAYDPFPWGLPRAADVVPVELAPEPPDESYDDGSDIEKTRIVDRTVGADRFVLQFSTGESVSVSGTGLIGRNPVAEPGEYFDSLVTIVDPGKSVSKTHLEFGQDAGAFWVSDRYSANGTVLREPDRPARRGDAGKRYRVVRGTRVDMGEQFFIVS